MVKYIARHREVDDRLYVDASKLEQQFGFILHCALGLCFGKQENKVNKIGSSK